MNVLITGGAGVLGQATADAFRGRGHAVVVIGHAPQDDMPGFDLTRFDDAARAFVLAREVMGQVTTVINIAGGFRYASLLDGGAAAWEAMLATNLTTCVNMCLIAAEHLPTGGAIVNVGAAAAARAGAGMGAYAAAKSGVARLTESLAAELQGRVRVNAIAPRIIDTPQNRRDMPDADPAGWTSPESIAEVILFLASEGSRAVNGATIEVANATR